MVVEFGGSHPPRAELSGSRNCRFSRKVRDVVEAQWRRLSLERAYLKKSLLNMFRCVRPAKATLAEWQLPYEPEMGLPSSSDTTLK